MASSINIKERPCTVLIDSTTSEPPKIMALKKILEEGNDYKKIECLKEIIVMMINGEPCQQLLMPIIRFALPSKNRIIKKLLLIYWEVVDKKAADGSLLHEMILVCNALMQDLNHPNEYIRGSTLRFMCKLKEPELLESLIESIKSNLEHRHSYVRRNAVLAIYSIYKDFEELIPDAPQIIYDFLLSETDSSCRRNAFLMLFNCSNELALEYLQSQMDNVSSLGEMLQLLILAMIRKMFKSSVTSSKRLVYMRIIFTLLSSSTKSYAVQYESAISLLSLSRAPSAVKAASHALIGLLQNCSDNNVKLIVLEKLHDVKSKHPKILQELVMEILRCINNPNFDIVRKTLDIALDLVTPTNINEVISLLKKEIIRSQSTEIEKGSEYRHILIKAIHSCTIKFPEVASDVVHQLLDFIGDTNQESANDVVLFVKEVIQIYPQMRESLISKLLLSFGTIQSGSVYRSVVWIIGEFSENEKILRQSFDTIHRAITIEKKKDEDDSEKLNGDIVESTELTTIQKLIYGKSKDYYLISAIATSLTKLVLRARNLDIQGKNLLTAQALLMLVNLLKQTSKIENDTRVIIDPDSHDWISNCINGITQPSELFERILLEKCGQSFARMIISGSELGAGYERNKHLRENEEIHKVQQQGSSHVDDLIRFSLLRDRKNDLGEDEYDDIGELGWNDRKQDDLSTRLKRIVQLTGLSDSIYAEANVILHQFDIVLDVNILNQTPDTLQNVSLELSTLGDLKISERPHSYNIGPNGRLNIKSNIRITSTDTGTIFGSIVYDISGPNGPSTHSVILNEIHIDIIDYVVPDKCDDDSFRTMWQEFEWESKVAIYSDSSLTDFVDKVIKTTNMECLNPESIPMMSSCGFISTNLCAKSKFGERALANISVHMTENGKISGFVRIRAKTRGIAFNLGEKISQEVK